MKEKIEVKGCHEKTSLNFFGFFQQSVHGLS